MELAERALGIATESLARAGVFRLPPAAVCDLALEFGGSVEQLMVALIPLARRAARPQLSGFDVGAVAEGTSGALYFGANFELDTSTLAQTIHAEQSAVACAIMGGEAGVERLAVSAPPCGHCRQFLHELSSASRLRILLAGKPPATLTELIPGAFGPGDLGVVGGLSGRELAALEWVRRGTSPAADAALAAARMSYAPYTGALAGVALSLAAPSESGGDGTTLVAGSYLENAAFNPSLSPLQTSLIVLLSAFRSPRRDRRGGPRPASRFQGRACRCRSRLAGPRGSRGRPPGFHRPVR